MLQTFAISQVLNTPTFSGKIVGFVVTFKNGHVMIFLTILIL